jgi:hypothetical protein
MSPLTVSLIRLLVALGLLLLPAAVYSKPVDISTPQQLRQAFADPEVREACLATDVAFTDEVCTIPAP